MSRGSAASTKYPVEELRNYFSRLEDYGYSFSILVADASGPILDEGYGYADHQARRPMTRETSMGVASLAKQFTSTAVLKLASEGKLRLDDPLTRFFEEASPNFARITIDHLLAHTSGIVDDYDLYAKTPILPREEWLQRLFVRQLAGPPGQEWRYANDGYSLLALIVERRSGLPFRTYMHRALFAPAGLMYTGFQLEPQISDVAQGWGGVEPARYFLDRWAGGLGGGDVRSNPKDLWRWDKAMQSDRILPASWRAKLYEPQIEVFEGFHYARGWWVRSSERETKLVFHSGLEEEGFNAWYVRFLDEGVTVIFVSNMAIDIYPLREAFFGGRLSTIEKLLFGGGEVPMPPSVIPGTRGAHLAGTYRVDDDNGFTVHDRAPWLEVTPHGQGAFEMLMPAHIDAAAREKLAGMTRRTEAMLEALASGDEKPFEAAVGERDDLFVMPAPSIASYEVLGTYPLRKPSPTNVLGVTFVHADGAVRRFQWSNERLTMHYTNRAPVLPLFRAVSETTWANWQPFLEGGAVIDLSAANSTLARLSPSKT